MPKQCCNDHKYKYISIFYREVVDRKYVGSSIRSSKKKRSRFG